MRLGKEYVAEKKKMQIQFALARKREYVRHTFVLLPPPESSSYFHCHASRSILRWRRRRISPPGLACIVRSRTKEGVDCGARPTHVRPVYILNHLLPCRGRQKAIVWPPKLASERARPRPAHFSDDLRIGPLSSRPAGRLRWPRRIRQASFPSLQFSPPPYARVRNA